MIRAVIDTNVFVSALISPLGNEALIVLAIRQGIVTPCYSDEILEEYSGVLARPKFSFAADEISALIGLLRSKGKSFRSSVGPEIDLPDPSDAKFVTCATAAGAIIVTGNRRHFPKEKCGGIPVVNAAELLDQITLEQ